MQVLTVQSDNYKQAFGATLKIHRNNRKNIKKSEINWLEKEFPKRTQGIKGHLILSLGDYKKDINTITYTNDKICYSNCKHRRYKDNIELMPDPQKQKKKY